MSTAENERPDEPDPRQDFARYQELAHTNGWPAWAPTFLTAFSRVPSISRAADDSNVSASTVHRLARRSDTFNEALDEVRNVALDRLETTIYLRATIGTPVTKTITKTRVFPNGEQDTTTIETSERHISDVLAMFYLKRWRPEYREAFRQADDGAPLDAGIEERMDEAVQRFDASVVRLAERRRANGPSPNGSH